MLNRRGYIKEKLVNRGCCFLFINADYIYFQLIFFYFHLFLI
jgi:hypothetical protein